MNEYLETAVEAARLAADIQMDSYRSYEEVESKGPADLVTEVDTECEGVIKEHITEAYPEHSVLGEETGEEGGSRDGGYRWIVDPVDGTTNYVHGVPEFCVSVGLEVDGELEVGVVHHVPDGDIYSAVRGEGAYLNDERITVSEVDDLSDALLSTGFTAHSPEEEDTFALLRHLLERTHGIRRFGSAAYDLATVAYGVVDCFYERHIRPWDVAAGILIVEEAGGRVTDYEGEDGWKSVREGGNEIVATNGDADVHDEVLRLHDEVVERVGVADEGLRTWK